jgi:hypothetical protein
MAKGKGILSGPQAMALGQCPHKTVKSTDAQTAIKAFLIHVHEAAVFTVLTDATQKSGGTPTTPTYPAGDDIRGEFTAFTLASGAVTYFEWPTPTNV